MVTTAMATMATAPTATGTPSMGTTASVAMTTDPVESRIYREAVRLAAMLASPPTVRVVAEKLFSMEVRDPAQDMYGICFAIFHRVP